MISLRNMRWGSAIGVPAILLGLLAEAAWGQCGGFRGVWVDVFHEGYRTPAQIDALIARAVTGRYNVILPEVLAYHDNAAPSHGAYWKSDIVPRSSVVTDSFDPLADLVAKAHAVGIEVHPWLVAFRASTSWPPAGNSFLAAHPEYLMVPRGSMGTVASVGGDYQLDPGSPDVQEYLLSIVRELITNYEIDGIHWDYIRYTQSDAGYPTDIFYGNSSLARFKQITGYGGTPSATGNSSWDDFRRRTITEIIRRVRAEIASIPHARQPLRHSAALITWGNAPANFSNTSAWARFQNWEEWMRLGYLDTAIPMTYYDDTVYPHYYRNWVDQAMDWRHDRHMVIGPAVYLNTFENSIDQMAYACSQGADGLCTYSYWSTKKPSSNDWDWYPYVADNFFTAPATVPAMPWRDPATATEGTLWGRVTDAANQPVDDASVQVGGLPTVKTDGNGYYVVTLIPAGSNGSSYAINVIKSGQPSVLYPSARVERGLISRYDFKLGASSAPEAQLSAQLIEHVINIGESLPDDTIQISNGGDAPLNYRITDNALWFTVSPTQGISTGEADPITISYDTAGLATGNYNAIIRITDAAASNSPQDISVHLTVLPPPVPGDMDRDSDVDQDDFGLLQACLTGQSGGVPPGCEAANLDGDNDVDGADVSTFAGCMTGPGVPGDPDCAGS